MWHWRSTDLMSCIIPALCAGLLRPARCTIRPLALVPMRMSLQKLQERTSLARRCCVKQELTSFEHGKRWFLKNTVFSQDTAIRSHPGTITPSLLDGVSITNCLPVVRSESFPGGAVLGVGDGELPVTGI